ACPHHGFSELHQLNTFYNALNVNDQDSLNSVAGGNFLDKMPRECLKIIESKSKVRQSRAKAVVAKVGMSSSTLAISFDVAELKDMVKALLLDKKNQSPAPTPSTTPAPVKAVEPNCVTCGGAHTYQNCPATHENSYQDNIQEGNNFNRGGNFNQSNFNPSSFNQGQLNRPQVNQAPVYQAPIPQTQRVSQTDFESYVKANDAILRNMQSQSQSMQNQCQSIQNQCQNLQNQMATLTDMMSKLVSANTASSSGSGTLPGNTITNQKEELKGITTRSGVAYQGPKTPSPSKQGTKEKLSEMARTTMNEYCSAVILNKLPRKLGDPEKFLIPCEFSGMDECLALADLGASINLMPLSVWEGLLLPKLTPTCMMLELVDRSVSKPIGIAKDVSFKVGVFHFPADCVVIDFEPDPRVPLILGRCFLKTIRALIDIHKGELTLRIGNEAITYNLDQTVRYSANYNQMTANKIDVIESACEEYSQEVLGFLNVTASAISSDVAELKDMVKSLLLDKKNQSPAPTPSSTPAPVKAVEPNCVTYGVAPVSAPMPNLKPSIPYLSRRDNEKHRDQANEQIEKFYEIYKDMSFEISFTDVLILMPKFASTLKALIENKEKLSEMDRTRMNEHCSAVILNKLPRKLGDPGKFLIPCEFPGMDECLALADLGASINLMPLLVWEGISLLELTPTCITLELTDRLVSKPIGIAKDVTFKVRVFHFPADFVVVDFEPNPRVPLILGRCFLKTSRALIDVYKGELTLCIRNEAITYNLDLTMRYSANYNQMTANKINVIESACEEYSQEVLGFSHVTVGGTHTPHNDPIVSATSLTLTSFRDSDFLLFKEADAFLAILNSKPSPPLPNQEQNLHSFKEELKAYEAQTVKSFIDEPPEVGLKDLPHHLEYVFLEGDNKLPVIIAKEMGDDEKSALIKTVSLGIFKFPLTLAIKKRQRSLAHMARLPTVACLLACAMLQDAKARLLRWVLLLQEFDFKVLDTKGAENLAADHLSRLENPYENVLDPKEINETFPLEMLSMVTFRGNSSAPWFAYFANYHTGNFIVKAYKTPIGCTPYKLVYGKAYHLPIELEHKAYWALKQAKFDLTIAGDH
nr:reverse transcriptase domain-containing protein [Tanacetum cinerariifolium]